MATFYGIKAYNQESNYNKGDMLESSSLYSTFDKACNAIDLEIKKHIDDFESPNRTIMKNKIDKSSYVNYYELYESGMIFVITKMVVVE